MTKYVANIASSDDDAFNIVAVATEIVSLIDFPRDGQYVKVSKDGYAVTKNGVLVDLKPQEVPIEITLAAITIEGKPQYPRYPYAINVEDNLSGKPE